MERFLDYQIPKGSFPGGSDGKESACNAGALCLVPGLGRCPGGGHGNPLQYSCLENPHGQSLAGYRPWGHKALDMTEWLSTKGGKCVAWVTRENFLRSWATSMAIMCAHILGTSQKKPKIFCWGNWVYKQFLITTQKMTCIAIAMTCAEYLTELSWRKPQIEFYNTSTGVLLLFYFFLFKESPSRCLSD